MYKQSTFFSNKKYQAGLNDKIKQKTSSLVLTEETPKTLGPGKLETKEYFKKFQAYTNQKKAGIALLWLDEIVFTAKCIIRDKEGHHIKWNFSIPRDDIKIVNMCDSNSLKYKTKMDRNWLIYHIMKNI